MKQTYVFILLTCVLMSCNSIKSLAVKEGSIPFIGTIGKERGNLLKSEFRSVGHANIKKPIGLALQTVPFTRSTFKEYLNAMESKGAKSSLNYIDSVETKPSYIVLSIADKIGLKESLNDETNQEVKSYLEKDAACRLVSTISVVLDAKSAQVLTHADGLFLVTDAYGILQIEVVENGKRDMISFPKDQIFDYSLMGVCWGENRVGKLMIETFNDDGRCPEGTKKNAKKLDEFQSVLKL